MNSPKQKDPSEENPPTRVEPGLKQTSIAATISFVFGVGALATLVFVRPAIILSVPAILFGHLAKLNLRRSNGELLGWGKARIGKILGYFSLAISLLLSVYLSEYRLLLRGAIESERTAVVNAGEKFDKGKLGEIEQKLALGDTTSFGNNQIAGDLAAEFRRKLRASLNKVLTHRDDKGLGLDTSGISCYCQFDNPEAMQVIFIAAIPELSGYNGEADGVLKKAAWQSALLAMRKLSDSNEASAEDPVEGLGLETQNSNEDEFVGEVAVGLMENASCEVVMLGSANPKNASFPSPQNTDSVSDKLSELIEH